MSLKNSNKTFNGHVVFLGLRFLGFLVLCPWEVLGQTQWQQYETKHVIIQYHSISDLKKFDRSIDFGDGGLSSLFSSGSKDPISSLKKKVDAIFVRVQQILDMYGKLKKKVIIRIHSDGDELGRIYASFTGGRKRTVRAWYIYEHNTYI